MSHRVALHGSKVVGYECTGVKCSGNSLYLFKLGAEKKFPFLADDVAMLRIAHGRGRRLSSAEGIFSGAGARAEHCRVRVLAGLERSRSPAASGSVE